MSNQIQLTDVFAHVQYFSKFLPFVLSVLLMNGILVVAGIYLLSLARRRQHGRFWRSRAAALLVPAATVIVVNVFMAELLVLLPAVAGLAAGWTLRHRLAMVRRRTRLVVAGVVGTTALVLAGALLWAARVGVWDSLAILLAFALGYTAGSWRARAEFPWARVALAGASLAVSLIVVELLTRAYLPVLPKYYSEHARAIRVPKFDLRRVAGVPQTIFDIPFDFTLCGELFEDDDDRWPTAFPQFLGAEQSIPSRAVLHLGDSLTQGRIADEGPPFPDLLQPATPSMRQINLGQGGTEPDFYYLIARKWVPRLPIELVLVHVFLGNDIWELGKPYRCCDDGPLVVQSGQGVEPRCTKPRWADGFGESLRWFAANSPPPAILRRYTPISQAARYAVAAIIRLQQQWFGARKLYASDILTDTGGHVGGGRELEWVAASQDEQWKLFEAILRTLRDELATRRVALVVSLLPVSQELRDGTWKDANGLRARALAILDRLHIETLDAFPPFASAVERDGPDAVFLPHGDAHFNAAGHRLYADWLLDQLGPRIGAAAPNASAPSH